ncbi:MAG: hypothetical protein PUE98_07790 [Galactobacillus timonensis]|uniref:hypothetical protein n=2 Tax=Galactobacillus timonensis TaxID=2041840 RepID=UPI00240A590C|nr:hypothetical protein [Galactobacillus timonensis]MDD6370671.1 hypothetical protein [Galactobacillus timonensis]MDD6600350.1 hypothetical protein [Galactobacillus timonensis]
MKKPRIMDKKIDDRAARALMRMVRLEQEEAPMAHFAGVFYELYVDGKLDLEQCDAAFEAARLFGNWRNWDEREARVFAQQFVGAYDCLARRRA